MRLYALQGQRNEAVVHYERCRQLLWEELGVEPDEETAALLVSTLAQTLGLNLAGQVQPEQQVAQFLHNRDLLLVLDNFEHLLAEDTALDILHDLLQEAPRLKLLVTSRKALNIRAEQWVALEGLGEAAAVSLFIQAAQRVRPDFAPGAADREAIQQIGRDVGGMPLAVELAATWVRLLDVTAIAQQIRQDIDFLATSLRDLPAR